MSRSTTIEHNPPVTFSATADAELKAASAAVSSTAVAAAALASVVTDEKRTSDAFKEVQSEKNVKSKNVKSIEKMTAKEYVSTLAVEDVRLKRDGTLVEK